MGEGHVNENRVRVVDENGKRLVLRNTQLTLLDEIPIPARTKITRSKSKPGMYGSSGGVKDENTRSWSPPPMPRLPMSPLSPADIARPRSNRWKLTRDTEKPGMYHRVTDEIIQTWRNGGIGAKIDYDDYWAPQSKVKCKKSWAPESRVKCKKSNRLGKVIEELPDKPYLVRIMMDKDVKVGNPIVRKKSDFILLKAISVEDDEQKGPEL